MRSTTLMAFAIVLFLYSCKTVEIGKQPVKTTVENSPTVNVGNWPSTGGANKVDANITNTSVPVTVQNFPNTTGRMETYETATGKNTVTVSATTGTTKVIEYINWTSTGGNINQLQVTLTVGGNDILFPVYVTAYSLGSLGISEKVCIVLQSGQSATLKATSSGGPEGRAAITTRSWKN